MYDISVKELSKLKQEAESEIAKEVSRILEDFKEKSGIRFAEHSIDVDMVYYKMPKFLLTIVLQVKSMQKV